MGSRMENIAPPVDGCRDEDLWVGDCDVWVSGGRKLKLKMGESRVAEFLLLSVKKSLSIETLLIMN